MIKKIALIKSILIIAFSLTASHASEKECDSQQPNSYLINQNKYNQEREIVKDIISSIEINVVPHKDEIRLKETWKYWENHQMCGNFICKHDIWYIHKANVVLGIVRQGYASHLSSIDHQYNHNNKK